MILKQSLGKWTWRSSQVWWSFYNPRTQRVVKSTTGSVTLFTEYMVCYANNQRDVHPKGCRCHGTTMKFVWATWFDKTRPSCFCACHHCHVFRQEVLV
jgi:hypothetical protein